MNPKLPNQAKRNKQRSKNRVSALRVNWIWMNQEIPSVPRADLFLESLRMESPCFNTISDRRSFSLWTRHRYSQTPPPPFSTWFSNLFTSSSSFFVTIFSIQFSLLLLLPSCCAGCLLGVYWICFWLTPHTAHWPLSISYGQKTILPYRFLLWKIMVILFI